MQKFSKAILRKPGKSMVYGLRSSGLGIPDYDLALKQHDSYIKALRLCGLETIVLSADERFPDSVFVEDTALLTPACAIITRPGAESRRGEVDEMKEILAGYFQDIHTVTEPGIVEAGDIMMVGSQYYIGISERTNINGAEQVIHILEQYGMTGTAVELQNVLHLKTGVSYLEKSKLLAAGEFLYREEFKDFHILEVSPDESYAANCIWVNDNILIPAGYPNTCRKIKETGYNIIEVDVSEFRKLDGGLSCLSLRF